MSRSSESEFTELQNLQNEIKLRAESGKLKVGMMIDDAVETLHATSFAKWGCLEKNVQGQPFVTVRKRK